MQDPPRYWHLVGPITAFLVVGVIALLLKWAYSGRRSTLLEAKPRTGEPDEYGLLVAVAAPASVEEGATIRTRLEGAGLRVTLAETRSGLRVLVFSADETKARETLRE